MKVDDQIEVKKIVKKSGSSFFWGMNVLDSDRKRAMFAIYAFCRIVDDIADEIKNKKLKIEKLKSWKKKINNIFESKKLKSCIEKELKIAVDKFQLERLDFYAIIDGMMMDAKSDIKFPKKTALVLGSEAEGMRSITKNLCDEVFKININKNLESLNVSNAAAITFFYLNNR